MLAIVIPVTAFVNFSPSDQPLNDMMGIAGFVQVFALMIGILSVTSEFRHGTITPSLLVVPDRVKLDPGQARRERGDRPRARPHRDGALWR